MYIYIFHQINNNTNKNLNNIISTFWCTAPSSEARKYAKSYPFLYPSFT